MNEMKSRSSRAVPDQGVAKLVFPSAHERISA